MNRKIILILLFLASLVVVFAQSQSGLADELAQLELEMNNAGYSWLVNYSGSDLSSSPKIEVYEVGGSEVIAEFTSLKDNELNKVFLDGSSGVGLGNKTQDTFDLLVLNGAVEFDLIIDPTVAYSCNVDGSATGSFCTGINEDSTDATIDSCVDYHNLTTLHVEDISLNQSSTSVGGVVEVTCYISGGNINNKYGIVYNNGSGWVYKSGGTLGAAGSVNKTYNFSVDNIGGTHYVRCWTVNNYGTSCGSGTTCCNTGTYNYDNDDLKIIVGNAIGESCTFGTDCLSGVCVNGPSGPTCQSAGSCSSSFFGYGCSISTSTLSWDNYGICTSNAGCWPLGAIAMNCSEGSNSSCELGVDTTLSDCPNIPDGRACDDTNNAGDFNQTGLCAIGANQNCETSNEVVLNATGSYVSGCAVDNYGQACDDSVSSGGNYNQDGICYGAGTSKGCANNGFVAMRSPLNYSSNVSGSVVPIISEDYDSDIYLNGISCDNGPWSGDTSYFPDGIVVNGPYCVGSVVRVHHYTVDTKNYFTAGCTSNADSCDNSNTGVFTADGVCASNVCAQGPVSKLGGLNSYNNTCLGNGGAQCDSVTSDGNYTQDGQCYSYNSITSGCYVNGGGNFISRNSSNGDYVPNNASIIVSYSIINSSNPDGRACDLSLVSGNFFPEGAVTYNGTNAVCTTSGVLSLENNTNYLKAGCIVEGTNCTSSPNYAGDSPWVRDGLCYNTGGSPSLLCETADDAQGGVGGCIYNGKFLPNDQTGDSIGENASILCYSGDLVYCLNDPGDANGANDSLQYGQGGICNTLGDMECQSTSPDAGTWINVSTGGFANACEGCNKGTDCYSGYCVEINLVKTCVTDCGVNNANLKGCSNDSNSVPSGTCVLATSPSSLCETGEIYLSSSSVNGYRGCSNGASIDKCDTNGTNGWNIEGICTVGNLCDTNDVAFGTSYFGNCSGQGGVQCDSNVGDGNYVQDGLCFDDGGVIAGTNFNCETGGWIFYNGTNYKNKSQVISEDYDWDIDANGESCDSSGDWLGGHNYTSDGMVISGPLCVNSSGVSDVVRVDASNNNYFVSGCDAGSGDVCDSDIMGSLDSPYISEGVCVVGSVCNTSTGIATNCSYASGDPDCLTPSYFSSCSGATITNNDQCDVGVPGIDGFNGTGYCFNGGCNACLGVDSENTTSLCNDGKDNDCDGLVDGADTGCDTFIFSCGKNMNSPGTTYTLESDLTATGTCLNISASGVELDGQEHLISGDKSPSSWGVLVEGVSQLSGILIHNVSVTNFEDGIKLNNVTASLITDVNVYGNTQAFSYGIYLNAVDFTSVTYSNVSNNHLGGIISESKGNNIIEHNIFYNSVGAIGTKISSDNNLIRNNSIFGGYQGVSLNPFVSGNVIANNIISNSVTGIRALFSNTLNIENNVIINGTNGIEVDYATGSHLIKNNNITEFSGDGVRILDGSNGAVVDGNNISGGVSGVYVDASLNVNITNNDINGASKYGVRIITNSDGAIVEGNKIYEVGSSYRTNAGVSVNYSNEILIRSNDVSNNLYQGIYITGGSGQIVEDNVINNNTRSGIEYSSLSGSFIKNNLMSGNGWKGVWLKTSINNNVLNNTISGCTESTNCAGIYVSASSRDNIFKDNVLINNFKSGVLVDAQNNIFENTIIKDTIIGPALNIFGASKNLRFTNFSITGISFGKDLEAISPGISNLSFINNGNIGSYSFVNINGLVFEDSSYGKIEFTSAVNGTGLDLSNDIRIGDNSVTVESNNNVGLNKSANVTLYGAGQSSFLSPVIFRDGVECPPSICINFTSLTEGDVKFSVTGWTNYSVGDNNTLPIINLSTPENYANLTNRRPFFNWSVIDPDNNVVEVEINITCYGGCSVDNRFSTSLTNFDNYSVINELLYLWDDGYHYNWSVRARDDFGWGNWSSEYTLNLKSLININLANDVVDFGSLGQHGNNDTTDNNPSPFVLENLGNVFVNVSINSSSLWDSITTTSKYYQFKIDNYTGMNGAFMWSQSITSFENMSIGLVEKKAISQLNYNSSLNRAETDLNISTPPSEHPGIKSATIYFIARRGK